MLETFDEVIIVGGSGFTGQRVVKKLTELDKKVYGLARSSVAKNILEAIGAVAVAGSLDEGNIGRLLSSASNLERTAFMYLASMGFGHVEPVVQALNESGIKRALFTSTSSIFTKIPTASKEVRMKAEDAVKISNLDWTIIRPTMIYGDIGDRNIERLIKYLMKSPFGVLPAIDRGDALQQPVHVEDLARAMVEALGRENAIGQSYEIGGPEALSLKELFKIVCNSVGKKFIPVEVPSRAILPIFNVYEKISKKPRIKGEQIKRITEDKNVSIEKARDQLNYNPRNFQQGVTEEFISIKSARK